MKRHVIVSVLSGFFGSAMLLILLSATGIVGARGADVRSDVSRANDMSAATPLTSTFTYQGQLKNSGTAVNGSCQMAFRLYDALVSGSLIGSPITTTVPVTNGLFTVGLNFGSNTFNGNGRWLDIQVNCTGTFVPLPRQAVTAAPYSFFALSTGALQSYPVTTTAPSAGQVLKWNGSAWIPSVDAGGTAYSAGFGLTLIGSQFKVVTSTIQQRVTGNCSAGQYVRSIDASGNVVCGLDANSGGTITNVTAGFGLAGGGSSGSIVLNVVTSTVQARVSSSCAINNAIRVINADGTVTCQATGGGGFWGLTGNAGTNPSTNFLGTTDNVTLTLRVNNTAALRIVPNATSPNIIGGYSGNFISATVVGSVIGGGGVIGAENRVQANYATVGGGLANTASGPGASVNGGYNIASNWYATVAGGDSNNAGGDHATIGGGRFNIASNNWATVAGGENNNAGGDHATIGGGYNNAASGVGAFVGGGGYDGINYLGNHATGNASTIGGGISNTASANYATVGGGVGNIVSGTGASVIGGYYNTAGGFSSFAAGFHAKANDSGAFVWADSTNADFASTGINQFLVRASGGIYLYPASGSCILSTGAGGWACSSDRNLKENFKVVDGQAVLQNLSRIPISRWNSIGQDTTIQHIGPMAQDFYAAFNLGEDNLHINTVDAQGVALAAIQGLYQTLQDKDAQIAQLQTRLSSLEQNQQPASFNWFNLLSMIAFGAVVVMWLQQHRSKRGQV